MDIKSGGQIHLDLFAAFCAEKKLFEQLLG